MSDSVPTLPLLSTLPFPYNSSSPLYLFPNLSSLLCLKFTLYSVHPCIYLKFSLAYNWPTNYHKIGTMLSVRTARICCTLTERKVGFSGE